MINFPKRIICPQTGEDITKEVYQELLNGVNLQRLKAARLQRAAAKARGRVGLIRNAKGEAIAEPKAFIHPSYYFSVLYARRDENAYLRETNGNCWEDEDFIKWEIKNGSGIAPQIERETKYFQLSDRGRKAPVFKPGFSLKGYNLW